MTSYSMPGTAARFISYLVFKGWDFHPSSQISAGLFVLVKDARKITVMQKLNDSYHLEMNQ